MKIERGFQSNCSELIIRIDSFTKEEVIDSLRIISKASGWKWGVNFKPDNIYFPDEALGDVLGFDKDLFYGAVPEKILEALKTLLDEETQNLLSKYRRNMILRLFEWPISVPGKQSSFTFWKNDGGFFMDFDGYILEKPDDRIPDTMPVFHAIASALGAPFFKHDGGHICFYLDWLISNFISEDKVKKYFNIEKYGHYKSFPPFSKDERLTKHDLTTLFKWFVLYGVDLKEKEFTDELFWWKEFLYDDSGNYDGLKDPEAKEIAEWLFHEQDD